MTHASADHASAATGHAPPWVAALAAGFLVLCMVLPAGWVLLTARRARLALRTCPLCGGDAVRNSGWERYGAVDAQVALQCGQCGAWRRLVVNEADERAHSRRLARESRRIGRHLRRLEAQRRVLDIDAFIRQLRAGIVGAEDFLAVTCPPATARHRQRGSR